jgi:hypothetical protein
MNERGWALIYILSVVALFFGILLYLWMQPPIVFFPRPTEPLVVTGHSWAAGNANITLTVMNNGTRSASVKAVLVDDVAVSDVTYGPAFSGTANTLSEGATGTITITQQFSSGIKYEFIVASSDGYRYVATAP